jgi:very-short-patch-repair endonuclease
MLWKALRRKQMCGLKFYRQYPISFTYAGNVGFFVADFYCHSAKLVVEIDGSIHDSQSGSDKDRTALLNGMGLRVVRFSNQQVQFHLDNVLDDLRQFCSPIPPFPLQGKGGRGDRVRQPDP